jgi:hypothetical protein
MPANAGAAMPLRPEWPRPAREQTEDGPDEASIIARLGTSVRTLAEAIGERNLTRRPRALEATAAFIDDEWRRQGYAVTRQAYTVRGMSCVNLEVCRDGTDTGRGILLVGAHYDSVTGSPGANDNGSGVAAMLELSRLFTEISPAATLRFVAFVNEEPPHFMRSNQMGSLVYSRAARTRGDDIRLMTSLETIGYYSEEAGSQRHPPLFRYFYPSKGNFVAFVSNVRYRRQMRLAAAAFRANSDFPLETVAVPAFVPGVAWSDHYAFWRQGYPAFMVTDTAFYRYAHYHTAEDTPDKICYEAFARLTRGLYHTFVTLAG